MEQCRGCGKFIDGDGYCGDCMQEQVNYKINHISVMDMVEHGSYDIYMV